jgi:methionyl-tRNA formyltransferase
MEDDNAGALYDRLMKKGAGLVLKTVKAIEQGSYPSMPQTESKEIKHAPKIFKETCEIQWNNTSDNVKNFIRGLSPYPGAWTVIEGKVFKIFTVSAVASGTHPFEPGQVFRTDNKTYLHARTFDGWVAIEDLQPEGKKKMTVQEFFRGNKLVL